MSGLRKSLVCWLQWNLDERHYSGLEWIDKEELKFKISWKHASRHEWKQETDSVLFKDWAIYTKRYEEGFEPMPKRWKANFRCALNASPDIKSVKIFKGRDAYRIYRFEKKRTSSDQVRLRNVGMRLEKAKEVKPLQRRQRSGSKVNNKRSPCGCDDAPVNKKKIKTEDVNSDVNQKPVVKFQQDEIQFRSDSCPTTGMSAYTTVNSSTFTSTVTTPNITPTVNTSTITSTVTTPNITPTVNTSTITPTVNTPNIMPTFSTPTVNALTFSEIMQQIKSLNSNSENSSKDFTYNTPIQYSRSLGSFELGANTPIQITEDDLHFVDECSSSDCQSVGCSSDEGGGFFNMIDEEDEGYVGSNEVVDDLEKYINCIENQFLNQFLYNMNTNRLGGNEGGEFRLLRGDRNPFLSSLYLLDQ